MNGDVLVLKLVTTPLIIALVSWIERRFGPAVAGLVFGFPMTSSLASAFLAVEQGPAFARDAAAGMQAGIVALAVFILAFAHAARARRWPRALATAAAAYVPAAALLVWAGLAFLAVTALAVATLAIAFVAMPRRIGPVPSRPRSRAELPARMAIGTALVVGFTTAADALGPLATGVLLLVPAVTAMLASFVLAQAGASAAIRLLRGVALGAFSFVAFFFVLATALTTMATGLAFVLAGLAAVGCSGLTYRLGISRQPA